MSKKESRLTNHIWQDRELRFDVDVELLQCRGGEQVIDTINAVEDTKGNNGVRGSLSITNQRLIWCSHKNQRVNQSIGLDCINSQSIRSVDSQQRGTTQALYVLCRQKASKFEFIFTSLVRNSPRLFTTIQAVHRSYETSRLYRDIKLRGSLTDNGSQRLLPSERVISVHQNIYNQSAEQGSIGTLCITNVRIVWFAKGVENFSVSVPYVQARLITIKPYQQSQRVLIIEAGEKETKYSFGFRCETNEILDTLAKEAMSCHKLYSTKPVLGVVAVLESKSEIGEPALQPVADEVIVSRVLEEANLDVMQAYYADVSDSQVRAPVYNEDLGIAMEEVRAGLTVKELWNVLS